MGAFDTLFAGTVAGEFAGMEVSVETVVASVEIVVASVVVAVVAGLVGSCVDIVVAASVVVAAAEEFAGSVAVHIGTGHGALAPWAVAAAGRRIAVAEPFPVGRWLASLGIAGIPWAVVGTVVLAVRAFDRSPLVTS